MNIRLNAGQSIGIIAAVIFLAGTGCKKGEVSTKVNEAVSELPTAVTKQVQTLAQESGYSGKAEDISDVAKGAAQEAIDKVNKTYKEVGNAVE